MKCTLRKINLKSNYSRRVIDAAIESLDNCQIKSKLVEEVRIKDQEPNFTLNTGTNKYTGE